MKTALLNAPVLQLADPERQFIVTTDASDFAIGAVLSQVWDDGEHPVAYECSALGTGQITGLASDGERAPNSQMGNRMVNRDVAE